MQHQGELDRPRPARRLVVPVVAVVVSMIMTLLTGAIASPASAVAGPITPAASVASFTVGTAITPVQFTATGTTVVFAVDVLTPLPDGLALSSAGLLEGNPTTPTAAADYIITATDTTDVSPVPSTTTINITVVAAPPPPSIAPASQVLTGVLDVPVTATSAFTPTSIPGTITYTISPSSPPLPAGLSIAASTGVVSGTPTEAATGDYIVLATDNSPVPVTATATISIAVPTPAIAPLAQIVTGPVLTALTPVTYTATSFAPTATFAITPITLPTGVTFVGGVLSGTPSIAWPSTPYTVTATSGTRSATTTLSLTVTAAPLAAQTPIVTTFGTTITPSAGYPAPQLASAGLVSPVAFTVSPPLPTGLLLNATTGAVSGKPLALAAAAPYVITATDANGATTTGQISITVTETQLNPPVVYFAQAGTTSGSMRVLFTAPSNAPVGQVYAAEVYDSTGTTLIKTVRPMTSLTEITGLTPGASFSIIVLAEASPGYLSSMSAPKVGVASLAGGKLTAPAITTISGGTAVGSIIVGFTPSANAPAGQTYSAQVYDEDQTTLVKSVRSTTSPITVTGLVPGTTYYVIVVADATAAFLESPSRGRTVVATANRTATTQTATQTATPTTAGLTPSSGTVGSARPLGAGWFAVTAQQAATAKKVVVARVPSTIAKKAPIVKIKTKKVVSLRVKGLPASALVVTDVKLAGKWANLGSARANAKGVVLLPAFQATKPGRYLIRLTSVSAPATYLAVVVSGKR